MAWGIRGLDLKWDLVILTGSRGISQGIFWRKPEDISRGERCLCVRLLCLWIVIYANQLHLHIRVNASACACEPQPSGEHTRPGCGFRRPRRKIVSARRQPAHAGRVCSPAIESCDGELMSFFQKSRNACCARPFCKRRGVRVGGQSATCPDLLVDPAGGSPTSARGSRALPGRDAVRRVFSCVCPGSP